MSGPSVATIKRLFAVSGNQCAFPKCSQRLVVGSSVVAELCHVKAAGRGGKRFDCNQTEEERHSFENLILMCPTHHVVIDSDVATFTAVRLLEIKAAHETKQSQQFEVSRDVIQKFVGPAIFGLAGATTGSFVGALASAFRALAPRERVISKELGARMFRILTACKEPSPISFESFVDDHEALKLKIYLIAIFRAAGWQVTDAGTTYWYHTLEHGRTVQIHAEGLHVMHSDEFAIIQPLEAYGRFEAFAVAIDALKQIGDSITWSCGSSELKGKDLRVIVWPAPK